MTETNITIFQSIKDTSTPFHRPVEVILERIKEGTSKEMCTKIRKEKDKEARNLLKQNLPAICFSGTFNKRSDNNIVSHSGLICLDFDGFDKKQELQSKKKELTKDKYTYACFVSPSGNGLKVLVKIPPEEKKHKNYFLSLQNHYNSPHFDKACKNISRVCYESYDPLIYINPTSKTWTEIIAEEHEQLNNRTSRITLRLEDPQEIVNRLRRWWEVKYPMVNGNRNTNMFILAAALNDFGVNKDVTGFVMYEYETSDFDKKEIDLIIESAYKNTINHGTKFFEDTQRVDHIKNQIQRGVPKKEIRSRLKDANVEDGVIDSVINRIEENNNRKDFWTKSQKGQVSIIHHLFKEFLQDHGFFKFCPSGSKNFVFVKVTNNLIDNTSEDQIKDFVLNYLFKLEDLSIYNYFADKTRYFKEDFLNLLSSVDVYFIQDDRKTAYLYYKNCAVKVTSTEVKVIDYIDLGGYVWKDQVIDRDFKVCKSHKCDYKTFISNIAGNSPQRIGSIESTIGFLLHSYKNLGYCPAVILNDEVISDNPEGGTGKGLFVNAISQLKKTVTIDGKGFSFERSFPYQLVSADSQLLTFDDVKKHFEFERLFSIVTEGITLEKKNKDAIMIPFEQSPKIIITTNYAITGKGNSYERRKWELELAQYYTHDNTPLKEFGRLLFGDWDEDEWCRFDNYMVNNLKGFLGTGLIQSEYKNLKDRKFIAETDHCFYEWATDKGNAVFRYDNTIYKNVLWKDFINEYPDFGPRAKMSISRQKFYKWLYAFAIFDTGKEPEEGRDTEGRYIIFNS
tara:strand:- start:1141 stop:3513 length:2373 start_codon:yes stop_codon:yes gene_type:complete